jgi:hypothetical protein
MLSKIRRSRALRLLYGVVPLAILFALFTPVAASAAGWGARSADWGARSAGMQVTYVNLAKAFSLRNNRTDYSVRFQLRQSPASVINADNSALALTSRCHDCGAIAIAFQVIFAPEKSLTTLNLNSVAKATSTFCVRCSTLAESYQIVDISNTQQRLTDRQRDGLEYVGRELEALRSSHLSTGQIQSKVGELASQTIALLQNGTGAAPASEAPLASPAINGPALPAQSAGISQPGIEVFVKVQNA